MTVKLTAAQKKAKAAAFLQEYESDSLEGGGKDWDSECMNCGATPTVHPTGLCGPCCFGEAETIGGNW